MYICIYMYYYYYYCLIYFHLVIKIPKVLYFLLLHCCHESGYHSPKLHITHGLHLPACTALTHSRPPLHQSHSCHHSLINPDCLTTPAPHSLTHIKAAHKHSLTAKSCFALATFLSVLPRICYLCVWPRTAWPWTSEPVPVTSTPAWYCLRLCSASDLPVFACWPLPVWFCPRLINIGAIGSACLRPLPYNCIVVFFYLIYLHCLSCSVL